MGPEIHFSQGLRWWWSAGLQPHLEWPGVQELPSPPVVSFPTTSRLSPLANTPLLSTLHLKLPILGPILQILCAMSSQWTAFSWLLNYFFTLAPNMLIPLKSDSISTSLPLSLALAIKSIPSFVGEWHLNYNLLWSVYNIHIARSSNTCPPNFLNYFLKIKMNFTSTPLQLTTPRSTPYTWLLPRTA